MSDDILYSFIFPDKPLENSPWGINFNVPVRNFYDILISQYNHYFLHGGRTPVHIIIQVFASLIGKNAYNVITVFFFYLFILLLGKCSMGEKTQKDKILYFIPFIIFFVLIIHPKCFYSTMACGINYLWSSVACLLTWLYLTKRNQISKYTIAPFFLLCFIAGWSHEGIVIPFSIALISYWIYDIEKNTWKTIAIIAFGIGALLLILAPGNLIRSGNFEFSVKKIIIRELQFFYYLRVFHLFILAFFCLYLKFGKAWIKKWLITNRHLMTGLTLSLPIFMCIGPTAPRVGFGIDLFSAILLGSMINTALKKSKQSFTIIYSLCAIIPIMVFGVILYYQYDAGKKISHVIQCIEAEKKNYVYIEIENKTPFFMKFFVQQYSIKEAPDWNKTVWENKYNKTIEFKEF